MTAGTAESDVVLDHHAEQSDGTAGEVGAAAITHAAGATVATHAAGTTVATPPTAATGGPGSVRTTIESGGAGAAGSTKASQTTQTTITALPTAGLVHAEDHVIGGHERAVGHEQAASITRSTDAAGAAGAPRPA